MIERYGSLLRCAKKHVIEFTMHPSFHKNFLCTIYGKDTVIAASGIGDTFDEAFDSAFDALENGYSDPRTKGNYTDLSTGEQFDLQQFMIKKV